MLIIILLFMNLFYAGAPTFMKIAAEDLSPLQIVYLRHTLALLAFLPFFLLSPQKIQILDLFKIMIASFFAFTLTSILQVIGMELSNASDGSFIMAMQPLAVIILAFLFLKEKLEKKLMIGLLFALFGFTILSISSLHANGSFNGQRLTGNLIFLTATIAEASFPIFLKPLLQKYTPLTIAFYCLLLASLYLAPSQSASLFETLQDVSWKTGAAIGYLGLGCSFLACFLWMRCLARTRVSFVAISWFIQPLLGCLFAFYLLHETVELNFWVGGFCILTSLFILMKKEKGLPRVEQPRVDEVILSRNVPTPLNLAWASFQTPFFQKQISLFHPANVSKMSKKFGPHHHLRPSL